MIFQGLFNILDLYFNNSIGDFYNHIDIYFQEKVIKFIQRKQLETLSYSIICDGILSVVKEELMHIGFSPEKIENYFVERHIENSNEALDEVASTLEVYSKRYAPIVYELFLEQIAEYLVETEAALVVLNLKYKGFFPTEFILELRNLKKLLQKSPEKMENLRKYMHIQAKIIQKFNENKRNIEHLEDLKDPRDKLQLLYSIFRIIDFFNLHDNYNFSHIIDYLQENVDEWLTSFPLITLKNPDLYFCGLFLAKHLNLKIRQEKITKFLLNMYEECIDEFEAPLFEATDRIYYYLKTTEIVQLWLDNKKVADIIKDHPRILETNYFKDFETSQLVVILKIYNLLGVSRKIDNAKIQAILNEIELRVTPEGVKQYRDGFITSEATYYVLIINYMRNTLKNLKNIDPLESIVSRIYRNLEFLDFSGDTNYDLISELFYSCESLKLYNCIETKEMIEHLAKFLFPQEVVDKILLSDIIAQASPRLRHFKVNRITGETIYK